MRERAYEPINSFDTFASEMAEEASQQCVMGWVTA